ncbi:hypothetical protein B296_00048896 [Ensete ventricosum]|uniref:Uncharacterized protein n=1 Tax=Ensete ventricosum TaxID=4639 RepID=A0A426YSW3_ENSVE|nr:hypothetical protein B296_00048896 [Ensete ventricosum]
MSSSPNKSVTSLVGASSFDNDLPITFRLSSRRRRGVEKSSSSSRKVVWIRSLQEGSQPSGPPEASRDLVQMWAAHDCSSVVTPRHLEELRTHFRVPTKVILSVPRGEDHPYHTFYGGFCLSIDALEVWLHLPSPLVAVAFLAF